MDGAGRWKDHITDRFHSKLGGNSDFGGSLLHASNAELPILGVAGAGIAPAPLRAVEAGPPPVGMSLFPQQPFFARFLSQQILARKSLSDGKLFGALADQHDVTSMKTHCV